MTYPKELAGLRALAVVCVLLNHVFVVLPSSDVGNPLSGGYGVKLFMIVSGFSIHWLLDTRRPTYGRFILGRAFRIFPVYLVGLIVSALMLDFVRQTLSAAPPSPFNTAHPQVIQAVQSQLAAHVAAHLTLLHGLVPLALLPSAHMAIIGQAWSLSVEWQFYLVGPFAIGWATTLNRRTSQVCLLGLIAGLLWCSTYLSTGFLGGNLAMLSLGIINYALVKRFRDDDGALAACMVAMIGLTAMWNASFLPVVIIWVTTIYSATTLRRGRFVAFISRGLMSSPLQHLGRISYSFFIFHMVALYSCLRVIDSTSLPLSLHYLALPLMSFALTVVFAEVSYRFVERPLHRFGKSLTERQPAQASIDRTKVVAVALDNCSGQTTST